MYTSFSYVYHVGTLLSCTHALRTAHLSSLVHTCTCTVFVNTVHSTTYYLYTSVLSSSGLLALLVMAVLFFWHIQHKSLMGFITTT